MSDSPSSKNQRRSDAREAARLAREKQKKREKLQRWLVPTAVSVGILAIVTVVVLVIVNSAPPPQSGAGPRNMASDGILFVQGDDGVVPVETPGIPDGGEPTPTTPTPGVANIVEYVDLACPICQQFEATYRADIEQLVASGAATLEVHPVAILDRVSLGAEYSSRANNAMACVADQQPESFLDVMAALFANQPAEQTTGLSDEQILQIVNSAGVTGDALDDCVTDRTFDGWLQAATERATSDPALKGSTGTFGTPTLVVNGERWQGDVDFLQFVTTVVSAQ